MRISKILPVIGLLLFAFIIWRSEPAKIIDVLVNINPLYFALSVISVLIITIIKGLKWRMVIRLHDYDYSLASSSRAWLVGSFVGIITPGRVGDLIRALYLNRKYNRLGRCVSTVIVDRVIELLVILVFALIGISLFIFWFGQSLYLNILVVFILACFALIGLMIRKGFMKRMLKPIFRLLVPQRHGEKLRLSFHEFYGSIGELKKKKRKILMISLFNVFMWLVSIISTYFFAMSIGINIGYFYLMAVISIMVIIELIPISVSGIGTRDAFLVFSLGMIGIAAESAIAFSIIYLILGYWLNGLLGFIIWARDPVKLS